MCAIGRRARRVVIAARAVVSVSPCTMIARASLRSAVTDAVAVRPTIVAAQTGMSEVRPRSRPRKPLASQMSGVGMPRSLAIPVIWVIC